MIQITRAFFYLLFFIYGGFRNYEFEYLFFSKIYLNSYNSGIYFFVIFIEKLIFFIGILALVFNSYKWIDLIFFLCLFITDIYFHNFIKFESSIILVHFIPLFFFFVSYSKSKENTAYIGLLFLAVGYFSSSLLKVNSGWLNLNDVVIYSYILEFNKGYGFNTILGESLIDIGLPYFFWKTCDYIIVIFQASFLILFVNIQWYKVLLLLAALFHLLIFLFLGISVFFPFMIYYLIIVFLMKSDKKSLFSKLQSVVISIVGCLCLILWILSKFDCHFIFNLSSLNVYRYSDYFCNFFLGFLVIYYTLFPIKELLPKNEHEKK